MSKGCKFIIMNKGGRVIQLLGKNHESFDLDLVLVPKTILRTNTNREMLNGYETQNGTKSSKDLAEKIMDLLKWFIDFIDISILTPEDGDNKNIYKMSYIKDIIIKDKRPKKALIDLSFTWKTEVSNHSNTAKYFLKPKLSIYHVIGLLSNRTHSSLLFVHKQRTIYQ